MSDTNERSVASAGYVAEGGDAMRNKPFVTRNCDGSVSLNWPTDKQTTVSISRELLEIMAFCEHWKPAKSPAGDIISRLRSWCHAADAAPASDLMDEAADEIARLRDELSAAKSGDRQFVTATEAERTSLERAIASFDASDYPDASRDADTLRSLSARLKHDLAVKNV